AWFAYRLADVGHRPSALGPTAAHARRKGRVASGSRVAEGPPGEPPGRLLGLQDDLAGHAMAGLGAERGACLGQQVDRADRWGTQLARIYPARKLHKLGAVGLANTSATPSPHCCSGGLARGGPCSGNAPSDDWLSRMCACSAGPRAAPCAVRILT